MSFNKVVPHEAEAYIEAVIDGHEDWQSALQVIEEMTDAAAELDFDRILLDFSTVDMRVAVSETPDIARIFDSFSPGPMQLGIIPSPDPKGRATVEAFASHIGALGHTVTIVSNDAERASWIAGQGISRAV